MLLVVGKFIAHKQPHEQTRGNPDRQANNRERGIAFLPHDAAKRDCNVVSEHGDLKKVVKMVDL